MYSCRSGATERPQSGSLSGYCINTKANPERLSLISSEVMELLVESSFLKRFMTHRNMQTIDVSYRIGLQELESGACVISIQWSRHKDS
jgi:hypothetical protein